MRVIKRILANLIDLFVFFGIIVGFFVFVIPFFFPGGEMHIVWAGVVFVLVVGLTFGLQYPFLRNNQTLGKAFFRLKIVSTNDQRPLTVGIIVQRELFAKILSCYLMCLPSLVNKLGKHDESCETDVVEVGK